MIRLPTIDTPREPVTDTYHGVEAVDDYRWLENPGSEAAREWTAGQDARTRAYLEALPFRDAVRQRFEEILKVESIAYDGLLLGGSTYFAVKTSRRCSNRFWLRSTASTTPPGSVCWSTRTRSTSRASPRSTGIARRPTARGSPSRCLSTGPRTAACTSTTRRVARPSTGPAARQLRDGGRLAGLARGLRRVLVHPARRAGDGPGRGPRLLSGGVVSRAGHGWRPARARGRVRRGPDRENFLATSPDGRWAMDLVQKGD